MFGRRRQLPSIEEAWNLPISAEMSSRAPKSAPPPYPGKRPEEPPPLTQHQLQTLQYLQRNSHNLSPHQQVNTHSTCNTTILDKHDKEMRF